VASSASKGHVISSRHFRVWSSSKRINAAFVERLPEWIENNDRCYWVKSDRYFAHAGWTGQRLAFGLMEDADAEKWTSAMTSCTMRRTDYRKRSISIRQGRNRHRQFASPLSPQRSILHHVEAFPADMSLSSENEGLASTSRYCSIARCSTVFYGVHRDPYYANYSSYSTGVSSQPRLAARERLLRHSAAAFPADLNRACVSAATVKDFEDLDRVTFGVLCTVIYFRRRPCSTTRVFFPYNPPAPGESRRG